MATNDIKFNIKQGKLTSLPSTKEDGTLYVATKEDSKAELYVDLNGARYLISDALTADAALSATSENAIQNKAVDSKFTDIQAQINAQGTVVYGTCSTAAGTAAKVVSVSGSSTWTLRAGSIIVVMFSATNTASNPTLNVNNTGAKPIYYANAQITTKNLDYGGYKNRPMVFVYNGSAYHFISWGYESGNTNTQVRVYRQGGSDYDGDYPLIASRTKASELGTTNTDGTFKDGGYEGVYGLISHVEDNIPTINPITGLIKAKGLSVVNKIEGSIEEADHAATADSATEASLAAALSTSAGSTTQPVYFSGGKPVVANAYSTLLTSATSDTTNNLSITVGGTTKTIADLTATKLETAQADTTKAYILGSSGTGTKPVFDDEIYLDTTAGQLVAKTFKGNLDGTASKSETLVGLTASVAELNYTDGVTSNIQTQLNGKASTALVTTQAKGLMSAADKVKLDSVDLTAIDNAASAYADAAKEAAIAEADSKAEQRDAVVLADAKSYTDTEVGKALTQAASTAQDKANKALADAKTYTNETKNALINGANNKTLKALEGYIDTQVSNVNSSFSNYYTKTDIDNKNFATKAYADQAEADAVATAESKISAAISGLVDSASVGYATLGDTEVKIKEIASVASGNTAKFANYYTKTESDGKYDSKGSASTAQSTAISEAKKETTSQVNAAKSALLGDAGTNYNTLGKLEDEIQKTNKLVSENATNFNNYYTKTETDTKFATKTLVSSTADSTLASAKDYTDEKIDALIGEGVDEALDTLKELGDALKESDSVVSGITTELAKKANISDLTAHTGNTTVHITADERTKWNGYDSAKAPKSHASTATTYGVGTDTKYGHLKISDSTTIAEDEVVTGVAASKTAVASLQTQLSETNATVATKTDKTDFENHIGDKTAKLHITANERTAWNAKAPKSHKSTTTDYGVGDNDEYGHLKLSDSTDSSSSTDGGVAATPKAVKEAYVLAKEAKTSAGTKADATTVDNHIKNTTVHITAAERTAWNAAESNAKTHANTLNTNLINGASSGYNTLKGLETKIKEVSEVANEATSGLATKAHKKNGVYYVEGTGTTDGVWVGSNTDITEYYEGLTIAFYINDVGVSGGDTLNINGLGAVRIWRNDKVLTTHLPKQTMVLLVYSEATGTATWHWADYDSTTFASAYVSTAAATAAKVASCSNYTLTAKTYIHVLITTANTSKTALTLNINNKGAKPIYINGIASSTSNYTLPAGTYIVYYDGTAYQFRTDGYLPGPGSATINTALTEHKTTAATGSVLGHVKLSDTTNGTSAASGGVAATPKAVSDALAAAKTYAETKASAAESNAKGYADGVKTNLIGGTPHESFADLEDYLEGLISDQNTTLTNKFNNYLRNDQNGTLTGNLSITGSLDVTGEITGTLKGNASTATTAEKLGTSAGDTNNPVYFSGGKPVKASGFITKVSDLATAVSNNTAAIATKANTTALNSHVNNTTVHITSSERDAWNGKTQVQFIIWGEND